MALGSVLAKAREDGGLTSEFIKKVALMEGKEKDAGIRWRDLTGKTQHHGKTFRQLYFDGSKKLRLDSETRQASDVEIEVFQILRTWSE